MNWKRVVLVFWLALSLSVGVFNIANSASKHMVSGGIEEIKLIENRSTGYTWHCSIENKNIVQIVSDKYKAFEHKGDAGGIRGIHSWKFVGLQKGITKVKFKLYRDWEPNKIAKTKEYVLIVNSPQIKISIDEIKEIKLVENRSKGYTWHCNIENKNIVQIVSDKYKAFEHKDDPDGIRGIHTWNFIGLQKGMTRVKFKLYEEISSDKVIKTKEYNILVSE